MKKYIFVIVLLFLFFSSSNVYAEVLSHQGPSVSFMYSQDNAPLATYSYNFNQNIFSSRGAGYVVFSFSIRSGNGGNTNDIALLNEVSVVGSNWLTSCNVGTVHVDNSTWYGETFSATCPVDMSNSSLTGLKFKLNIPYGQNAGGIYYSGLITYSANPYFDATGITNQIVSSQNATVNAQNNTTNAVNNNTNAVNNVKNSVDSMKNTINDDSTTGASSSANNFFSNFSQNNHGLSGIITSPLRLIQSITSSSCSPLEFSLPFVNQNVQLPCMKAVISTNFPTFYVLFELIITGLLCYRLIINFLSQIRKLQDPEYNRIGVLQL